MNLAAIDIGSNAARLYICTFYNENDKPQHKVLEFVRVPIRLGDFVFLEKQIPAKKESELLDLMKAFRILMDLFRVDHFKAVATSALREAHNGPEIVKRVLEETGIGIEIISGKKEAELIYKAQHQTLDMGKKVLFVDVGGGSTELSLLHGHKKIIAQSFDLGTVRILDNQDDEKVWKQLKQFIQREIEPHKPDFILGSGGNINKAFDLMKVKQGKFASDKQLKETYKFLQRYSLTDRINKLGMNPDRADVIIPALEVYLFIQNYSNINKFSVTGLGLKEGLIYDLYYELNSKDAPDFESSLGYSEV
jgi:exopolyphosphatase/guanosine-5'-triphosphate,3'-diphosphate pyrophosphatase